MVDSCVLIVVYCFLIISLVSEDKGSFVDAVKESPARYPFIPLDVP
jgi:hypothetical protein